MAKITGHAQRTREVAMVNDGRKPMAAKKKRARKSNAKHARKARAKNPAKRVRGRARAKNPTHRRRLRDRRRNPGADVEGSFAAIAGGVVGRLARGAATTAAGAPPDGSAAKLFARMT